jgi:hypothetical protein
MFKKRQRQMDNTAAASVNLPRPVSSPTIHNHAPSEAARIFAWAVVYLIGALIGWFFLLYLLREMGARNPVEAIGWFLFGSAGLLIVSIAVDKVATKHAALKREFLLQLEEIRADRDRSLALTASQPLPNESRLTEEDSKFAALLRTVMAEAYKHLDEKGQYGAKEAKPWVRRANAGKMIPGFDKPVTELMAGQVGHWLKSKGVIDVNGIINIDEKRGYPTLAHFVALLESEFYVPIQVNKALSPALRQEVSFIEN